MEKIVLLPVHQEAEGQALLFSQFERFLFTPPFSPLKGSSESRQVFHL